MTHEEMKKWIDNASYSQLLSRWRFAPVGSPWFQGEIGDYYTEVLTQRRNEDPQRHVATSKEIGWEK